MMGHVQRLAPGRAIDNSPGSLEDDFESENEALSTKARKVIEYMQRRWLIATFSHWADTAQKHSTDGVDEGPVMVKKAHSAVQRSARPAAAPPADASTQERDEHAALEEMGTTMRVQQEQIERLKQEATEENMRFIAKEYQWKQEKAVLQNRIELFKQKFERQEATLSMANEIQAKHSEAVGSQAQVFLLGQAMRDAMQDSEIHMNQMSSTIDWLEQIIESCHADTLHQQHKLENLERYFGTPTEERVQRLEASVSKQRVMLQELQTENAHLKMCLHNLEVQSMTRKALLEGEEQVRKQLRAKHEENERLLKILHDMDATLAKKGIVKEAVGFQQATMLEHMHSEIALISMERETTENLLKDAIAKNDDLESLTRQLYGILRYLQEKRSMRRISTEDASPLRWTTSPEGPPVTPRTRDATRAEAPQTPYVGKLPETHDPVWPTVTRSPHISNMPSVMWSEEAVPETITASRHWRPGRDYPAAPPITPTRTTDLLPQMPRSTGREPDRTGWGPAHEVCAREASQHRKAVGHSPFTSPSLMHSRAPNAPLIEIEPSLHHLLETPQRAAPSPLLQSSPRGQRAVNQYDATPPEFGLSAEIIYNTVDTHWASFVQRQNRSFTASPNGVNSHRDPFCANDAEVASSQMPQRASSPAMQRASSSMMQRSAPPPPAPVPKQGNEPNSVGPIALSLADSVPLLTDYGGGAVFVAARTGAGDTTPRAAVSTHKGASTRSAMLPPEGKVLSHPMLSQQFAHFLDEQRKKGGLSGNISDIHWALRIGQDEDRAGEKGPPGTAVPEGTGGGPSFESAHVIAREIARLQASRAEDAERLKALTQRKAG